MDKSAGDGGSARTSIVLWLLLRLVFEGRKQFTAEYSEGTLFLPRKGLEESRLIRHMREQRTVKKFAALVSQSDQRPPHYILYEDGQPIVANPLAILTAISNTDKGTYFTSMRCCRKSHEPKHDDTDSHDC